MSDHDSYSDSHSISPAALSLSCGSVPSVFLDVETLQCSARPLTSHGFFACACFCSGLSDFNLISTRNHRAAAPLLSISDRASVEDVLITR